MTREPTQSEIDTGMVKIDQLNTMWNEHEEEPKPRKHTPVSMVTFFDSTQRLIVKRKKEQDKPF